MTCARAFILSKHHFSIALFTIFLTKGQYYEQYTLSALLIRLLRLLPHLPVGCLRLWRRQHCYDANGGSPQTVFTSSSLGIKAVRVISNTSLLLLVKSRGPHVDTSQNGLWRVNTDGTGLASLSRDSAELDSSLNPNSQYPWSSVSRDGSLYSLQSELFTPPGTLSYALLVGSLHGGSPMAFASISDGTRLELVGWTTM